MSVTTNATVVQQRVGGVKLAMTALAGGAAPTLEANTLEAINEVTVVATNNDSVILPAGMPQGSVVHVFNRDAAQNIKVYPNTGGTVNGGTATTAAIAVGATMGLICVQAGTDGLTWLCLLGAICVAA